MAELTRDRGQLLLVGALAIAVAMVVLSLLLNSAIFTQAVATRDIDTGSHDALQYRNATVDAVSEIIDDENDEEYVAGGGLTGQEKVYENVTHGIERYSNLSRRASLSELSYATVNQSTLRVTNGTLLRQTDPNRVFGDASATPDGNWTLATDVNVRQFSLVVESADEATAPPTGDAFTVNVSETAGSSEWKVFIYDDGGLTIDVNNETDPVTQACPGAYSPPPTPTTINLTAGTVNGEPCAELVFATGVSAPYDIDYTNGTNAEGTYNLTVDTTAAGNLGNFQSPGSGQPYEVPAVYSVEADVLYERPRLRYNDSVRVAPGEPA